MWRAEMPGVAAGTYTITATQSAATESGALISAASERVTMSFADDLSIIYSGRSSATRTPPSVRYLPGCRPFETLPAHLEATCKTHTNLDTQAR